MVRLALCSWLAAAALFAGQAGAFLHTPQVGGCFLPSRSVCDSSYRSQRVELAAAAGPVLSAALVGGAGATFSGANSHVLRMLLAGRSRHAGVCRAQLGETAFHSNESACYEEVCPHAARGMKPQPESVRDCRPWHCGVRRRVDIMLSISSTTILETSR